MYPLDRNSTIVGYMRRQRFLIKDRKMKKKKMAKSFAKQAGVNLPKKVKSQSEKYDY